MDLRSYLQDVLSEVSSEAINFQIELHSLIILARSSGLIQNYRFFEGMHHGITTVELILTDFVGVKKLLVSISVSPSMFSLTFSLVSGFSNFNISF